jgi:transcription initiation factor IIE alpha subunit
MNASEALAEVERLSAPVDLDRVEQDGFYCAICDDDLHATDDCDKDEPVVCDQCARRVTFEHAVVLARRLPRQPARGADKGDGEGRELHV